MNTASAALSVSRLSGRAPGGRGRERFTSGLHRRSALLRDPRVDAHQRRLHLPHCVSVAAIAVRVHARKQLIQRPIEKFRDDHCNATALRFAKHDRPDRLGRHVADFRHSGHGRTARPQQLLDLLGRHHLPGSRMRRRRRCIKGCFFGLHRRWKYTFKFMLRTVGVFIVTCKSFFRLFRGSRGF